MAQDQEVRLAATLDTISLPLQAFFQAVYESILAAARDVPVVTHSVDRFDYF